MKCVCSSILVLTLLLALIPTGFSLAEDATTTILATYQEDDRVVLDLSSQFELSSLDPQVAKDRISVDPIENLFHGLTDYDPITSEVVPEMATSWEIDETGTVWTFHLRADVMWYRYDPVTETAEELRPVTAGDFVYSIKRGCDPRLGSLYGAIVASVIAGCDIVNHMPDADVTDELVFGDTTSVRALDDITLAIELQYPVDYFLSMSHLRVLTAVHPETLQEFGAEWTAPGNITTNGPYFVQEVTRGVRRVFVRNYDHLEDLDYGGNIDQINYTLIEDRGTTFALYLDNLLEMSYIPGAEIQNVLGDEKLAGELVQVHDQTVFYFGFANDTPPFNNVHVRRAFSAIIDRNKFIEDLVSVQGVPMIHFTPPSIFGSLPTDEVGIGFDPEYARTELAEGGYPDCEGFPETDIEVIDQGDWGEFLVDAAEEHLGCSRDLFTIESLEFPVIPPILPEHDSIWSAGWAPDYPDANIWVFDAGLSCESPRNEFKRPCTELDDLIDEAARETDTEIRADLYREIEEGFFGPDGEHPIAPLYMRTSFILVKLWYTGPFETDGLFGGQHWDTQNIDMAAKLAARGE